MKIARNHLKGRKGFTLIELIIVVIIVGVLASIALPQYTAFVERARSTEAINTMGAVKKAQEAFRMENVNANYATNATFNTGGLGITPSTNSWTYGITTADATRFIIQANRVGGVNDTGTIIMNYNSNGTRTWSGNHPGVPRN